MKNYIITRSGSNAYHTVKGITIIDKNRCVADDCPMVQILPNKKDIFTDLDSCHKECYKRNIKIIKDELENLLERRNHIYNELNNERYALGLARKKYIHSIRNVISDINLTLTNINKQIVICNNQLAAFGISVYMR